MSHLQNLSVRTASISADPVTISVVNTDRVIRANLTANATLNLASVNANDGQQIYIELAQDVTGGRIITLGTGIAYGTDIATYIGNKSPSKTDVLGFVYHKPSLAFRLVAIARGF